MDFRILGPLEVDVAGGPVALGGRKQRCLLALLLLHPNEVVSSDRLIDELWGERPPATAAKTLQVMVSALRKRLEPERGRGEPGRVLLTRSPGYLFRVEAEQLDLACFERLCGEGREAFAAGDSAVAARELRDALALWRGPPLADLAYEPCVQSQIAWLGELRLAALEDRLEADLALGRHADVVGELEALVREHRVRERLPAQLMLALYRSGRQAEALAAYQDARRALLDDLGIQPGRSLRELEQAILRQDPALDLPSEEPVKRERPPPLAPPPPAPEPAAREMRKTVTVVCVALLTSAQSGEGVDPEALRRVTSRAFGEFEAAVERYGGTAETEAGDALSAVFGLPVMHEDDALRTVRATAEIRERLATLAGELEREGSVRLEFGIGVSTGGVVTGGETGPRMRATGEPMSVSSRLARAAEPAAVLLDEGTRRLVREAVVVEPSGVASVSAFRLVEFTDVPPGHRSRFESPMVGRDRERRRLHDAFEQAVGDRSCQLFTVLGAAGVGKSRLVAEFLGDVASEALVARGRCLPYGDGITYWPLFEALRSAAGLNDTDSPDQSRGKLAALVEGDEAESVARRVAEIIGVTETAIGGEEAFSAVRGLLEMAARRRPLVLFFDDVQWGEATFLDLVEHITDWSREAPILLICLARPELLDIRPGWAGGKLNATSILLEPLSDAESAELVENLAGDALETSRRGRIVAAAEGNPLFAEEMLALVMEDNLVDGELEVPPNIQALLAARLDRLSDDERSAIEAASVEGKVFHESSVAELVPDASRASIRESIMALVRKELIRPDRGEFSGELAFRFRHLLIRDAAYESIPKQARAKFHERHAAWLERAAGDRVPEYDEILGYHLEQAFRYRSELGPVTDAERAIGRRAAERLAAANRRAFIRGDPAAAVKLISRAGSLLPPDDPARIDLVPNVRVAQGFGGDLDWAVEVLDEAIAAGDDRLAAQALVQKGLLRLYTGPQVRPAELIETAERAIAVFAERGEDLGLARAWRLLAGAHYLAHRAGPSAQASQRALVHARRARNRFEETELVENLVVALALGPTPAPDAARCCERLLVDAADDPLLQVNALAARAHFIAIQGHTAEAQELLARSRGLMDALGEPVWLHAIYYASAAVWADDPMAAEHAIRPGHETLARIGEKSHLTSFGIGLAQAVYAQGRYDEAAELAGQVKDASRPIDVHSQTIARTVTAKTLARRGQLEAAERLAHEAIGLIEGSDFLPGHAEALTDLAEILRLTGRTEQANQALAGAVRLYEQKGNVVAAAYARALLNETR